MIPNQIFRNSRISAKQLISLGIIFAGLGATVIIAQRPSVVFVLLPFVPMAVWVLLKQPELGLVGLIVAAMFVPFGIGTGSETDLNIAVLGVAGLFGVWIIDMARRRQWGIFHSAPLLPLGLFCLVAFFSFILGLSPLNLFAQTAPIRAQLGGLAIFVLSACIFTVVAHQISEQRWLEYMVWLFIGLGAFYIAGRLIPRTSDFVQELFFRGASGATGSQFWLWLVVLPASQAVFNDRLNRYLRVALLGLAGATLAVGWFQGRWWVSGYLPGLVALGALVWLRSWRLGLLGALAGGVYLLIVDPTLLTSLVGLKGYSIDTRAVALQILLGQVLPINPFLGLGPANYYWYTPLFPILGYYVQFNSHNQYVDIVMQTGVLGMMMYLWFFASLAWLGLTLRSKMPNAFARAYVNGALAGLVGMMMAAAQGDWVIPFVYNIGLSGFRASMLGWMFLGGIVALQRLYPPNARSPVEPAKHDLNFEREV